MFLWASVVHFVHQRSSILSGPLRYTDDRANLETEAMNLTIELA